MNTPRIKAIIATVIGIILVMLFATLYFSLSIMRQVKTNLANQVHTRTIIITLKDNLNAVLNAESGGRGFSITGDSAYLRPYFASLTAIAHTTNTLQALTQGDSLQHKRMDTLQHFIDRKIAFMENLNVLKYRGEEIDLLDLLIQGTGSKYMDSIRHINQTMQEAEAAIFATRQADTATSIANAKFILVSGAIFSLLVTLFLAFVIIRELNLRTRNEKQLSENNAALERKNKEIEQFAYVASHDLQEPLRSISNFTTLLGHKLKSHPEAAIHEYMRIITSGTQRMSTLIFDMLEYSRIGRDMTPARINCNELVQSIVKDMHSAIETSHAEIRVGKLPVVMGYSHLRSLFQNLLANAIKFQKPDEHPVINISATDLGKEFEFRVQDNGIGIDPAYFDKIFLMFQRLHSRSEYVGTGIGLAQCKKVVELHGGHIRVESEPGNGSTFIFTLPKKIA